jgi:hypothetical protein
VPRTARLCRSYGLEADVYSAEKVLGLPNQKNWKLYLLWELPFYLLLTVDPKGKFHQYLAKRMGGRK